MLRIFYNSLLVLALLPALYAQSDSSLLTNVTQAFSQAQVVPDVLPSFAPTALANITFPVSTTNQAVNVTAGALLTEPQTANEPAFSLISSSTDQVANQTFVLALVDPDAPTPQNTSLSQFLHFLGGDFRVNASTDDPTRLVNQSAALMDYFPPTPPEGSPPHRYVLVVYSQPNDFADTARSFVNASTPRNHFNLTTFATSVKLSNPMAGNFFFVGPKNSTASTTTAASATPGASTATAPAATDTTDASDGAPTTTNGGHTNTCAVVGMAGGLAIITLVMVRELCNF
ncbi:putative RNA recognition motif containing protein [Lyophyllum shimeji]|uniref:RNA recognition motif containing protein n=1 Tax=Lyophyllum shimeji TaxID=47721 RepID=A0A9P3PEJ4_LYOSH|nr:putative RNA recognition motif containing protein [Lyophyllum shimeji]